MQLLDAYKTNLLHQLMISIYRKRHVQNRTTATRLEEKCFIHALFAEIIYIHKQFQINAYFIQVKYVGTIRAIEKY